MSLLVSSLYVWTPPLLQFIAHLSGGAHSPAGWRLRGKLLSWCCSIVLRPRLCSHLGELQHWGCLDPLQPWPVQVDGKGGGVIGLVNQQHMNGGGGGNMLSITAGRHWSCLQSWESTLLQKCRKYSVTFIICKCMYLMKLLMKTNLINQTSWQ